MLYSTTILAWGIVFSRLALANTHIKSKDHDLSHITRRSLSEKYDTSSGYRTAEKYDTKYDTSSGYSTAVSSANSVVSATVPTAASSCYSSSVSSASSVASADAPTTPALPLSPVCDATRPKFAINGLLVSTHKLLRESSDRIMGLTRTVDKDNSQQMADLITAELQTSVTALKTCLSSVQVCGIDSKPLSANQGTTLSDVSWSALQIVLTLKTMFESVSVLYTPFPLIKKSCSAILMNISSALSSLIGACSEQLNLFDTRFFPLVTPQLKEFEEVEDNFSSFFGSFISN